MNAGFGLVLLTASMGIFAVAQILITFIEWRGRFTTEDGQY